jgi:hypothetical protein
MSETQVLRVERGEQIVLSPESPRFQDHYQEIRPRSAAELREIIGLPVEVAQALHERGAYYQRTARSSKPVAAEDLDSRDDNVRVRAWTNTGNALRDYVYATDPQFLEQMEPAFAKYLGYSQIVLKVAVLPDIVVADGGTMLIPEGTDVVRANNIIIHGTGKIVCHVGTKIEANTIVGT